MSLSQSWYLCFLLSYFDSRCVLITSDLFLLCFHFLDRPSVCVSWFLVLSQCRFSWLVPRSVWCYFCSVSQSARINGSPSPPHDLLAADLDLHCHTDCSFMLGSLKLTSTYHVKGQYYQLGMLASWLQPRQMSSKKGLWSHLQRYSLRKGVCALLQHCHSW